VILSVIAFLAGLILGWWYGRRLAFDWFAGRLEVLLEEYPRAKEEWSKERP